MLNNQIFSQKLFEWIKISFSNITFDANEKEQIEYTINLFSLL